ncbi:rod shape-determining protein MreD [Pelosinus sp. sgz500959]|uniref:rod shape-determining protein MreD n=1 Tax=Pelosinus sp. sgz500959 TaxID=3242472 RepID=UPI00366B4BBF
MKTMIWLSVIIVTIIIQSTVLPLIAIQGIYPDMLLVVVVSYALLSGKEKGVGMGFFAGLLQDLASGSAFGTNTLSKLAIGYFFGLAERKVFKEHVLLPVATTAVATIFNCFSVFAILSIFGYKIDIIPSIMNNVLPISLYNLMIAIPVHHLIYRLKKFTVE